MRWLAETAGAFHMRARQMSIGFQGNSEEYVWYDKRRIDALRALLERQPDNYVIFYSYEPEFFELFEACSSLGYSVDVCSGSIKSEYFYQKYQHQSEAERLINKKNVILANFQSGAAGSNWQLYDKCVLFSTPCFGDWQQSIKRVHRLGTKSTVVYHVFCSDDWLDGARLKALKESKDYNDDMFEADLKRAQGLIPE